MRNSEMARDTNLSVTKSREKNQTLGCFTGIIGGLIILLYFLYFIFYDRSADFWPFIVGFLLLVIGAVSGQSIIKDDETNEFNKKGIDKTKFIPSGKYVSGHSEIDNVQLDTYLYIKENEILIYFLNQKTFTKKYLGKIDNEKIKNIVIEDETTIQRRVGLKRMIALGVFAFALKKKVKQELAYVIIEWEQGRIINETVFEFEGNGAVQNANRLRNKLIKSIKL